MEDEVNPLSCGVVLGKLYLASLRKLVGGKGHEKCIFLKDNDKRVTPQEFEALGGGGEIQPSMEKSIISIITRCCPSSSLPGSSKNMKLSQLHLWEVCLIS